MKKGYLSIIIILCTIISVILMTHDYNLNGKQECAEIIDREKIEVREYQDSQVINNTTIKDNIEEVKENCNNDEDVTKACIDMKNNNEEKKIIENLNNSNNSNNANNANCNEKDDIGIIQNEKNTSQKNENIDEIYILNEKDVSVFKVDADKILDELTLNEKKTLLFLGTKFSPIDYVKIKNYLYMDDREEGVSCALKLAEKRLTNEDFKKMEDVIDEYIDVDAVEKKD
ncbi:hypothetical protein [Clostridium sp. DL1XJH146]